MSMFVFHFRAIDRISDRGMADVIIVSHNSPDAYSRLNKLRMDSKRTDLKFRLISINTFKAGIVCNTIESRLNEADTKILPEEAS